MSSSDHKQSPPPGPDQQQPYPPTYPPFTPPGFPPGAYPPPFYTYAPPGPDGAQGENGGQPPQPPHPYMMYPPPPGMVYAYPPGQPFYGGQTSNGRSTKRKQVKMACTNCAAACKRCDEARPCERCIKYGLIDQCQDGVRKERKKGVKRGPYKRKAKATGSDGASFTAFTQPDGEDWSGGGSPGASSANTSTAVLAHAMPPYPGPPSNIEGYYPYYYPPPGGMPPGFMQSPPGHEGQPPDGSPNQQSGPNGGPPVQFFPVHPGYTPFPHYPPVPPPGSYHMHHAIQQHPQTMDPKRATADRQESEEDDDDDDDEGSNTHPPTLVPVPPEPTPAPSQRKRGKAAKTAASGGEPKSKKAKTSKKAGKAASSGSLVEPTKQEPDAGGSTMDG